MMSKEDKLLLQTKLQVKFTKPVNKLKVIGKED